MQTQTYMHGDTIPGFGAIRGMFTTPSDTVYLCYNHERGYAQYPRPIRQHNPTANYITNLFRYAERSADPRLLRLALTTPVTCNC